MCKNPSSASFFGCFDFPSSAERLSTHFGLETVVAKSYACMHTVLTVSNANWVIIDKGAEEGVSWAGWSRRMSLRRCAALLFAWVFSRSSVLWEIVQGLWNKEGAVKKNCTNSNIKKNFLWPLQLVQIFFHRPLNKAKLRRSEKWKFFTLHHTNLPDTIKLLSQHSQFIHGDLFTLHIMITRNYDIRARETALILTQMSDEITLRFYWRRRLRLESLINITTLVSPIMSCAKYFITVMVHSKKSQGNPKKWKCTCWGVFYSSNFSPKLPSTSLHVHRHHCALVHYW